MSKGFEVLAPMVKVYPLALAKMRLYMDSVDTEIGWLGLVDQVGNEFHVTDTILPKQEVGHGHTDMDEDALGKFIEETATENPELLARLGCWGHKHPGTSPEGCYFSSTDDNTLAHLPTGSWFLSVVGVSSGHFRWRIDFYTDQGQVGYIEDLRWELFVPAQDGLREAVKAEVKEKVTEKHAAVTIEYAGPSWRSKPDPRDLGIGLSDTGMAYLRRAPASLTQSEAWRMSKGQMNEYLGLLTDDQLEKVEDKLQFRFEADSKIEDAKAEHTSDDGPEFDWDSACTCPKEDTDPACPWHGAWDRTTVEEAEARREEFMDRIGDKTTNELTDEEWAEYEELWGAIAKTRAKGDEQ